MQLGAGLTLGHCSVSGNVRLDWSLDAEIEAGQGNVVGSFLPP